MPERSQTILVEDLWVSYRSFLRRDLVLRGVSLRVNAGEIAAIIGRNGAGKTTFFRSLMGLQVPDSGRILIEGRTPSCYRSSSGIGFLPEVLSFPPCWTTRDILGRAVDLVVPRHERSEAFERAVERTGFDDRVLSKPAGRCSKGTQRRIGLAYTLIGEPKVVLLDEPFAGLDPPSRITLRRDLAHAIDMGATVFLASHDLSEVASLADVVFTLADGAMTIRSRGRGSLRSGAELEQDFMDDS